MRRATDLRVLLGPPGLAASDGRGVDLVAAASPGGTDLLTVDGRVEVAQALIVRLLTPLGSLAPLGHPEYGSRLHLLVGRGKTVAARALCKAYVLEAVAAEPRVEATAVAFGFDPAAEGPGELRFTLAVRPADGGEPVVLALGVEA